MKLEQTIENYLNELSSNSPTPGGGNVAAFCAVLSSSLGIMVCNLTIGKKKYIDVEAEIIHLKTNLESYKTKFQELAKNDNESFDEVMAAFKLPKETEEEKKIRAKKIEEATLEAAIVPSNVIETVQEIIPLLEKISKIGNQSSLSDAGVALHLCEAAAKSAYLNVMINCASLSNQTIAQEMLNRIEIRVHEIESNIKIIISTIINKMRPAI